MIPFLDLAKVNNRFRSEIDARFARILDKGWYLQGEENETFPSTSPTTAAQNTPSGSRTDWTR